MAGRRSFGTIRKLPSGRWQASYFHDGQRHTAPGTFRFKADAAAYLSSAETDLRRGAWVDPKAGSLTLAEYKETWYPATVRLTAKSRLSVDSLLLSLVLPAFGDRPLSAIRHQDVQRWVAEMSERVSPSRVRQAYGVLSRIMASAVRNGVISVSPCGDVELPRLPRREPDFLTAAQLQALAATMPAPYNLFVEVLAYGGLRFGEGVALRRCRLDLMRNRIVVAEAISEVNGRLIFGEPKSHQMRTVAIPPSLTVEMAEHLDARVPDDPQALVFTSPAGAPLRSSNFRRRVWDPACSRVGLAGKTPHILRRTCTTLLLGEGASVKDVQAQLGHSTAMLTVDTYAAFMASHADELAGRLDNLRISSRTQRARQVAQIGSEIPQ